MDYVYKVLTTPERAALLAEGQFAGSAADRADGFVHLSARDQVRGTLARHFRGQAGLWLLAVDPAALPAGALRWEVSRRGAAFPHLYAPLPGEAVRAITALPVGPDGVSEPGPDFPVTADAG